MHKRRCACTAKFIMIVLKHEQFMERKLPVKINSLIGSTLLITATAFTARAQQNPVLPSDKTAELTFSHTWRQTATAIEIDVGVRKRNPNPDNERIPAVLSCGYSVSDEYKSIPNPDLNKLEFRNGSDRITIWEGQSDNSKDKVTVIRIPKTGSWVLAETMEGNYAHAHSCEINPATDALLGNCVPAAPPEYDSFLQRAFSRAVTICGLYIDKVSSEMNRDGFDQKQKDELTAQRKEDLKILKRFDQPKL